MKKTLITLLALSFLFLVSCSKDIPKTIPEENTDVTEITPIDEVREHINNEKFEKAYELLLTLEGEEAEELLSHFSFKYSKKTESRNNEVVYIQSFTYDKHGKVIEHHLEDIKYPLDSKTYKYEYDDLGRPIKTVTTSSGGAVEKITWKYDESGNVVEKKTMVNGALDNLVENSYDEKGNHTWSRETDMYYSAEREMEYNENGDIISSSFKNSMGDFASYTYVYDSQNRLIEQTFNGKKNTVTVIKTEYTDNGKISTHIENEKIAHINHYDKNGNETLVEYPQNTIGIIKTETSYNQNGEIICSISTYLDENGNEYINESKENLFNENGKRVKTTETYYTGDVYTEDITYHKNGNIHTIANYRNEEKQYECLYNEKGLPVKSISSYDYETDYTYDTYGNLLKQTSSSPSKHTFLQEYEGYTLYYNPNI